MTETILLVNGNIYTGEPGQNPQAMAIQDGLITKIDSTKVIKDCFETTNSTIDLGGRTVWPGLVDSHLHFQMLSERLVSIDCEGLTLAECLQSVQTRALQNPGASWLMGFNWNQNIWMPAEYGTAAQLDAVSGTHPVVLYAKSLHASWVNTVALRLAGIDENSVDPQGGRILRDSAGQPTGILLENAMDLVDSILPVLSNAEMTSNLLIAQQYLLSLGITGIHDFDRWESAKAILGLVESDQLKLRVCKNLPANMLEESTFSELRDLLDIRGLVRPGWIKCFADGALGPQSAAILEPYENSNSRGMLLLQAAEILEIGIRAGQIGWPLAIHAIGDAAVREVLNGFQLIRDYEDAHHLRHLPHRIEHVQLLAPQDVSRLKSLDIIASVQPIHATSDMYIADHYWGKRAASAYAFKSLLRAGTEIVFGSDAPVESPNPFFGLHAAVTRQRPDGEPGAQGWHPEQRVNLSEALDAYTLNPAAITGQVNKLGKLAHGFLADLIVLPEDPFKFNPHELWKLKPDLTMVTGKIVFTK